MWILVGGFFIHLVFLMSMFDIYFKTPIVHGINHHTNNLHGPAKRLVFFVADGLRADSFFSHDKNSTPYLRKKIEEHASWGVSHTRVPTESRPGVVALTAGIYEDPSAVFKGWKENPVEFDSLFNQSRHTWAWGSPDIVPIFAQSHVETFSYQPEDEDFSGRDSSWRLDKWVFDHVEDFLHQSKSQSELNDLLNQDKIIFFLHLLGLDTAGHSVKPQSVQYQENLRVVDRGVQQIEELVEAFYDQDGRTAFVFTADHGMTDWGSHGAGSRHETEVPFLAWGAGVKGPQPADHWDPSSPKDWKLSHLKRKDVNQADIVTLLASLIGCSIPVNSVGRLPWSYLHLAKKQVAELTLYNALQLLAQADRKRELVQSGTLTWLYTPYSKLGPVEEKARIESIRLAIKSGAFDTAINLSEKLAELSIKALHFYHNYYKNLLLTSISLAFLGWIAWVSLYLAKKSLIRYGRVMGTKCSTHLTKLFFSVAVSIIVLIQVQGLPLQFNVYCLLPLFLWWAVFCDATSWLTLVLQSASRISQMYKLCAVTVLLIACTEIMVIAFFQRWVLSLGVLGCAIWPLFTGDAVKCVPARLLGCWLASCAALAIFPLLPVIGSQTNLLLVCISGCLWLVSAAVFITYASGTYGYEPRIFLSQMFLSVIAILNVVYVDRSMEAGNGLPFICQLISWILLFGSPITCLLGERMLLSRLSSVLLALLPPYLLLSVRHEAFFLLTLSAHLLCWLLVEAHLAGIPTLQMKKIYFPTSLFEESSTHSLSANDFRRAALFVFYVFLSFFGTGNIASLNSFEVLWVRCFVAIFSPFTMMVLILFKMILPFVVVCTVFRAINITLQAPTSQMFYAALIVCDSMGLHFLHLVTNEGSWLDIGTSISHYVIVQVTVLVLLLLYGIASVLTGASVKEIITGERRGTKFSRLGIIRKQSPHSVLPSKYNTKGAIQ